MCKVNQKESGIHYAVRFAPSLEGFPSVGHKDVDSGFCVLIYVRCMSCICILLGASVYHSHRIPSGEPLDGINYSSAIYRMRSRGLIVRTLCSAAAAVPPAPGTTLTLPCLNNAPIGRDPRLNAPPTAVCMRRAGLTHTPVGLWLGTK